MPLDTDAYLKAQGWEGKGSGLRSGAIARPVPVIQKKTLSGVGKDRDEAFPFWDHVFQAASLSIQVKLHKDSDDESGDTGSSTPVVQLTRTTTGIISNRRPNAGTPALSGTDTPEASGSSTPRLSIMAAAKREAARRTLYSGFYRGPVLGPDSEQEGYAAVERVAVQKTAVKVVEEAVGSVETVEKKKKSKGKEKAKGDVAAIDGESRKKKDKKRKAQTSADWEQDVRGKSTDSKLADGEASDDKPGKKKRAKVTGTADTDDETAKRRQEKVERRARKAEKKARKEERRARKETECAKESPDGEDVENSATSRTVAEERPTMEEATRGDAPQKRKPSKEDGETKSKKRKKTS